MSKNKKEEKTIGRLLHEQTVYRELTIQLLYLRNDVFRGGGMDRDQFTQNYLNGLGEYERKIAREEGIEIDD